jgi:hypothetical protein
MGRNTSINTPGPLQGTEWLYLWSRVSQGKSHRKTQCSAAGMSLWNDDSCSSG